MVKFEVDYNLKTKCIDVAKKVGFSHLDFNRIVVMKSKGSSAQRTIARCYALGKAWQKALYMPAHYIIEVLSEKFDKLSEEEQVKTLIHEMMHIPKTFGGGFRQHDFVCSKNVNKIYAELKRMER